MQKCLARMRLRWARFRARPFIVLGMNRRDVIHLAAAGVLAACNPPKTPKPAAASSVRGVCFDLFTLFDPRAVEAAAASIVPDAPAFCEAWRGRQFQYAFLRAAADRYVDFRRVTDDALVFVASSRKVELAESDRRRLVDAYTELPPWPDTKSTLAALREANLRLAPLANYSPDMIAALLGNADLERYFDHVISTDRARTYKPDPKAYALGPSVLGLDVSQVAFCAFGGWDAAGAKWFGLPTVWINRLGVTAEELSAPPDATGPDLSTLSNFVATHR